MHRKSKLVRFAFLALLVATALPQPAGAAARRPAPPSAAAGAAAPQFSKLDSAIREAMRNWGVAGLSIAIVSHGRIVYLRGFGVRDVRTSAPVDADTVFAVGSITKSFTGVLAALLAQEGRIGLDDPLASRLTGLTFLDPYRTGAATFRDALSHRVGFDWRDDTLMLTARSRQDVVAGLARIPARHPFRSEHNYSNVVYVAAGEALAASAGDSWDNLIARRIFGPLGMTRSSTSLAALEHQDNVATPHRNEGEGPVPIARAQSDVTGAAGAINSTARDLAAYLLMLSGGGRVQERPFLQPGSLEQLLTPESNPGVEAYLRGVANFHLWGLGWELLDYRGRLVAAHGGIIDGMQSQLAFVPSEQLGVVVLTNTDGLRYLPDAIVYEVLDRWLGAAPHDWERPLLSRATAFRALIGKLPARIAGKPPTLPLSSYAGRYRSTHGEVDVRLEEGRLVATVGLQRVPLEHWHFDSFRGVWGSFGARLATFALGSDGTPRRLSIDLVGEFDRVGDAPEA